jgi:DNA-binding CsgD family transcriptional regulator
MGTRGFDEAIERCRVLLDEQAFDAAWAEGHAMSREEGFAYGMSLGRSLDDDVPGDAPAPPVDIQAPSGPSPVRPLPPLTPRESEVARLIARGLTNRQIADELVTSERTVHSHVYRLLGKLGFASRAQVAAWVVSQGLVSQDTAQRA